jgi:3-dehydroquinate dehydratase
MTSIDTIAFWSLLAFLLIISPVTPLSLSLSLSFIDAVELRVDLLKSLDEYNLLTQISLLRRNVPYLPIIFTVRSKGQGGRYSDDDHGE